jgi:hypothetical protein
MQKWIIVCLLLTACGGTTSVPEGIIPEAEMELLMLELHLAEAIVTTDYQKGLDPKLRQQMLTDSILIEKQIDRETFLASYEYYLSKPALMDTMYSHIIDSLNHALTQARVLETGEKTGDRNPEIGEKTGDRNPEIGIRRPEMEGVEKN